MSPAVATWSCWITSAGSDVGRALRSPVSFESDDGLVGDSEQPLQITAESARRQRRNVFIVEWSAGGCFGSRMFGQESPAPSWP